MPSWRARTRPGFGEGDRKRKRKVGGKEGGRDEREEGREGVNKLGMVEKGREEGR